MTLADLQLSPWLLRAFAFAWGAVWGSFVNVVIYRVPREMSVVRPASHCPGCGKPIGRVDNVPIVSWLLLRGRARCCGVRISPPLRRGRGGVGAHRAGGARGGGPAAARSRRRSCTRPRVFLADFGLAMALIAAAFIDLEHMYLPDAITHRRHAPRPRDAGPAGPRRGSTRSLGAAVGFVGVWLPFVVGYKALRGRPAWAWATRSSTMLAGAWFGWPGVVFAIFAGALQATLAALVVLLVKGKIEEPESVRARPRGAAEGGRRGRRGGAAAARGRPARHGARTTGIMAARLPFGPFLCLAILEWMLAGAVDRGPWCPGSAMKRTLGEALRRGARASPSGT